MLVVGRGEFWYTGVRVLKVTSRSLGTEWETLLSCISRCFYTVLVLSGVGRDPETSLLYGHEVNGTRSDLGPLTRDESLTVISMTFTTSRNFISVCTNC